MSFTSSKREQIKKYILEKVEFGEKNIAPKTAKTFHISDNTCYRYIRELEADKIIQKKEGRWQFVEKTENFLIHRTPEEVLEEDIIYEKNISAYIKNLPNNVKTIWQYSFTEMMNNAIEHSLAEKIFISVFQSYAHTTVIIFDNGVGIFKKIKEYYNYDSLDDAVNELFKGKLTTDSSRHSGEGIFFTSRVLDTFAVLSSGKIFTHNKYSEALADLSEIDILKDWKDADGTIVLMQLSNYSNKILKEVFDMFSDIDGGFTKTRIPVKNIFESFPVSRSQAKRLCHRFENFEEIELDFSDIDEIGQGFAHEIFVVFQNEHPNVILTPQNTSPAVSKMISHVMHR